jgi:hypothetical protein
MGGNVINVTMYLATVFVSTGSSLVLQLIVAKLLGDEGDHCGELRQCRAELLARQTEEVE